MACRSRASKPDTVVIGTRRPFIETTTATRRKLRPLSASKANASPRIGNRCLWIRVFACCRCRGDGRCPRGPSAPVSSWTCVVADGLLTDRLLRRASRPPQTPRPARRSRLPTPSTPRRLRRDHCRRRRRLPEAAAIPRRSSACSANATLPPGP